ncbi:surfeit locus 1 family protein [Rubricella aquisinus]|uniref:SURF1-like protein n=1 Tax=Rubricella aquisinus TaxID=2028108 RepID=A0A840X2E0_9RHOB|nr:SURF1 family protein [Rubricella aquisinus]MBB5516984.1 surfeit locus 1 family protein [Rubricella aquisinus]
MKRTIALVLIVGVLGTAVLCGLGLWQLQRLGEKEAQIAAIAAQLEEEPVALPDMPTEAAHEYLPVRVAGRYAVGELHVLTTGQGGGAAYRIIAPFLTVDGRRIMVDRGVVPGTAKDANRPAGGSDISGHLIWPDETDSYTFAPDIEDNEWFARDVPLMAEALGTEPVLIQLARTTLLGAPRPTPVTVNLPNNHLGYAVQWFGLAIVWAGMTVLLVIRTRRKTADTHHSEGNA